MTSEKHVIEPPEQPGHPMKHKSGLEKKFYSPQLSSLAFLGEQAFLARNIFLVDSLFTDWMSRLLVGY